MTDRSRSDPLHPARWLVPVVLLGILACSGCNSGGSAAGSAPLSQNDWDEVYLRSALQELIRGVFIESNPGGFDRFFPPKLRGRVDTDAMYRRIVGEPPGTYQPRIWEATGVEVHIDDTGTRAGTQARVEFLDTRPSSGGAGKFITINLTWAKQQGRWYLAPLPGTAMAEDAG